MSEKIGKIVSCDRCGASVFLRFLGEEVMDGGFTKLNKFESMPDGWGNEFGASLCPQCFYEAQNVIKEFMKPKTSELQKSKSPSVTGTLNAPDYCKGCNQVFAPIDQRSCWMCYCGELNTSRPQRLDDFCNSAKKTNGKEATPS